MGCQGRDSKIVPVEGPFRKHFFFVSLELDWSCCAGTNSAPGLLCAEQKEACRAKERYWSVTFSFFAVPFPLSPFQRAAKGGVENSGGWKTYRKFGVEAITKNVFGPPTYDTFPPPFFCDSLSFPSNEGGTDQTNPNF